MRVPERFAQRMSRVYGKAGADWIVDLPSRIRELEADWDLRIGPPVPNLTYNYVAFANGAGGETYVVKLSPASPENAREATTMAAFAGRGGARLFRHDPDRGAMLLERIDPGDDLRHTPDPEAALVAAEILEQLWQAEIPTGLVDLEEWTRALERFETRESPLPRDHLDRASGLRRELLLGPPERVVLHGDLHHTNVLRSQDRGWLAIDPKGIVGEKAFDILMFLLNPEPVPLERNLLRVDAFVDRLQLDRPRVLAWCYVQSVVSACWTVEDREEGWEGAIRFAEALSSATLLPA